MAGTLLTTAATMAAAAEEPNFDAACRRWTPLANVITPVGWRDHLHRFNVLYDGTILARPPKKPPRVDGEADPVSQGVQLTFIPTRDGAIPRSRGGEDDHPIAPLHSLRTGDQGWTDDVAPMLWTRWKLPQTDAELRHLVFAHKHGGGESETGVEPMYAWIRLQAPLAKSLAGFLVKLNAPHLQWDMLEAKNLILQPAKSTYPRGLRFENGRIIEADGRIRLGVGSGGAGTDIRFIPRASDSRDSYLYVNLPPRMHVDLLLPMIPADPAAFEQELKLGRAQALVQANAFWSPGPPTAATIHTPEPQINAAIDHSLRLTRMISLTIPATKEKTLLSGSMVYSLLWITPTSMAGHMLLDPLGWHGEAEKYLEIHRQNQGKVKAPGPQFPQHPGYFGVPQPIDSGYQWLTDHGAVLYTAARHALITDDQAFIARWIDPILRGCDFMHDCRRLPREAPQAPLVMPAASASDKKDPIQSFWSDAWNYKGIASAARLLRRIHHPRAEEIQREADDYKAAIVAALRAKAGRMPKWKDRAGRERVQVPMSLSLDDANGYGIDHPFYLDTGPMFGVWAGVLPADDPFMRDAADFFRQGPHVPATEQPFVWDMPAYLLHEMSSAEPCYSWNVFHSHALGEEQGGRERYLQCMYSLFAGALSRQTFISCETRGGITENVFANPLAVDLVRIAVVDDELEPDRALHLLRLAPLAWFSNKEETRFENMPTDFGPVTLQWELADGGKTLRIEYAPRFRVAPKSVVLHVPPLRDVAAVSINGKPRPAKGGDKIALE